MPRPPRQRRHARALTLAALPAAALLLLCPAAAAEGACPDASYVHPTPDEVPVPQVSHRDPFTGEACAAAGEALSDPLPHVSHHDPFLDDAVEVVGWVLSGQAVPDTLAFVEENRPHVMHDPPL